jgi:DNA-3-methyladenine glycosylase II
MRRLVGHYGPCAIRPHQRYFETLVKSIVSQQLSTRAAETIFTRFRQLYPGSRIPKAELLLSSTDEELRGVGLSFQKIGYIRDLAARVAEGRLRLSQLPRLSDDEVIAALTEVKGIGVWTAQMFLIFSLARLDVFPVGDLGVRKAIQQQFELPALPGPAEMEELAATRRWAPWRSVASWYLWRSLENTP